MQVSQTQRLTNLTRDHYEPLTAVSGILARLLEEYLEATLYHLVLYFEDRQALGKRLREIARETASNSFFYFCRLLLAFDAFASQASGAYLFPDSKISNRLRRLQNTFIGSLPRGTSGDAIDVYHIFNVLRDKNIAGYQVNTFRELVQKPKEDSDSLQRVADAYTAWLLEASPQVLKATGALSAFSSILRGQLEAMQATRDEGERATVTVVEPRSEWWSAVADDSAMAESDLPVSLGLLISLDTIEHQGARFPQARGKPPEEPSEPSGTQKKPPKGHTGTGGQATDPADVLPKDQGKLVVILSETFTSEELYDLVQHTNHNPWFDYEAADKKRTARAIVARAYREGWLNKVMECAVNWRQENVELAELVKRYGIQITEKQEVS